MKVTSWTVFPNAFRTKAFTVKFHSGYNKDGKIPNSISALAFKPTFLNSRCKALQPHRLD